MIIEIHFGFKMDSPEETEEIVEKPPEVDLKVLEAIKAKELAEDRFLLIVSYSLFYHRYIVYIMRHKLCPIISS